MAGFSKSGESVSTSRFRRRSLLIVTPSILRWVFMHRDFEITNGIYLVQPPYELDLHNNFEFHGLHYSVEDRRLLLNWRRSKGEWVASGTPASVSVEFREVSEFRFLPRNAELPFTEDDCVSSFGYWTDELKLTLFHGHLIVLAEGVQNEQSAYPQAALSGAIS